MTFWKAYIQNFRGFDRNIRLFLFASLFSQIGMGVFMVMYNLYIQAWGYPESVNGQVISMTSLATAIALIPAGLLSDRYGRKSILLIGGLVMASTLLVRAVVETPFWMITMAFFTGFFMAFLQVAAIPFLAEHSDPSQRIHLFSMNFAVITCGQVIGNVGGGVLTDLFQFVFHFSELKSLQTTLGIGGLLSMGALLPLVLLRERPRPTVSRSSSSLGFRWHDKKGQLKLIGKFTLASAITGFGAGMVIPYLNLYFSDRFDASHSAVGVVISLGQAATALAIIIGPLVVSRMGEVRAVVFLQMASIPFLLLTAFSHNFYWATFGFLMRQALMNAGNPIIQSMVMARVDDDMKGFANSVNQMVFMLGWALMGPISTGIVAHGGSYWGYAQVFCVTAILYVVGSAYFYWTFRSKSQSRPGPESQTIPPLKG
ncbi:MFS transporter [Desmospora profundinema]|uniref:MFS family permease n=1 Tax=Desmospora profundinema TaxID=1571184 RepID=A0ABU1IS13_9BACL|nr:MFS transporter [Desmospora profundinema]MDR6227481.1 MFS family permease [Desmospora profundinema]